MCFPLLGQGLIPFPLDPVSSTQAPSLLCEFHPEKPFTTPGPWASWWHVPSRRTCESHQMDNSRDAQQLFSLDWLWPFTTSIGTSWYAPSQPCCPCPSLEGPPENVQKFAEDAAGTVEDACSEQSRALGFTCHPATETRIPGGCRSDMSCTLRAESTAVCSIPTTCTLGLHGRKVPARLHVSCASLSPALQHSGSPCQRGQMGHAPKSLLNLRARGDIPCSLLG